MELNLEKILQTLEKLLEHIEEIADLLDEHKKSTHHDNRYYSKSYIDEEIKRIFKEGRE